jgi:hypothetical protein
LNRQLSWCEQQVTVMTHQQITPFGTLPHTLWGFQTLWESSSWLAV